MKCSELWLREWVKVNLSREQLCERLTMAGLEVESMQPAADKFNKVVIGLVRKVETHPQADRLHVCSVLVGSSQPLTIVCGASNVREGMKAPVALLQAKLPNDKIIAPTTIRGVASFGMLCSAVDLGFEKYSEGLLELPADAKVGEDLRKYLQLDDYIIDVSITPNRGDCLSIQGMAREIATLTHTKLKAPKIISVKASCKDKLPITLKAKTGCPRYVGRVIRGVKADITTPAWIQERLRRGGVRCINPIVDVTNYVMLELGQPMHAFDVNTIKKGIQVRWSKAHEKIALLDGSKQELDADTLVIADIEKPLAIAGVMGGLDSSVTLLTQDIFLESAYFSPAVIARQRQAYNLNSDSAYRFERGVDPTLQREAIERATQLILKIACGQAGPIVEVESKSHLPKKAAIILEEKLIQRVLGISLPMREVERIFTALQFSFKRLKNAWRIQVPSYRFDISLPEDIIEELARLYGYEKIPLNNMKSDIQVIKSKDNAPDATSLRYAFANQGFHEIISYSFVDKKSQALLDPNEMPRELLNPISADMSVMRTNLWPGLINTFLYNRSRQQQRIRLFEIGVCFIQGKTLIQDTRIGGLIAGPALPEQWGEKIRSVDFFDLKGNLENIIGDIYPLANCQFKRETHPALHPGQTAGIYYQDKKLGILGALHPSVKQALDITEDVFLFELNGSEVFLTANRVFTEVSKFPEVRRDLALLINEAVPSDNIQDTIVSIVGDWLKDIFIFDVYKGKGISPGVKSVALALILQHPTRTLVDDEVARLMNKVITALKGTYGAELRS